MSLHAHMTESAYPKAKDNLQTPEDVEADDRALLRTMADGLFQEAVEDPKIYRFFKDEACRRGLVNMNSAKVSFKKKPESSEM